MNKFTKDLIFSFFPFIVYTIIKPNQPGMAMYIGIGLLIGLTLYYLYEGNLTNVNKLGYMVSSYVIIYRITIIFDFYYGIIINLMELALAVFIFKLFFSESNMFKWMIEKYFNKDDFSNMNLIFGLMSLAWGIYFFAGAIHYTVFSSWDVEFFRAVGFLSSQRIQRILLVLSIVILVPMCLKRTKSLKRI